MAVSFSRPPPLLLGRGGRLLPAHRRPTTRAAAAASCAACSASVSRSSARRAADLESPDSVGRIAAERTLAKLGARRLGTRKAPVLFENRIATGLVGHLLSAVSGASLYREASFLRDAAGTQIFPDFVQIDEDPHLPRGLGSAPFDSEGARTVARPLVAAGVLNGYLLDSYAARRLGMAPSLWARSRLTLRMAESRSERCTGRRIVRD